MEEKDNLFVLWASGDPEVAKHMVFMYTRNAKLRGWWESVRLIVWGPSQVVLAGNKELQKMLAELQKAGVEVQACKKCADEYGVGDRLAELGIDVIYMGVPLTEYLKDGWAGITV